MCLSIIISMYSHFLNKYFNYFLLSYYADVNLSRGKINNVQNISSVFHFLNMFFNKNNVFICFFFLLVYFVEIIRVSKIKFI